MKELPDELELEITGHVKRTSSLETREWLKLGHLKNILATHRLRLSFDGDASPSEPCSGRRREGWTLHRPQVGKGFLKAHEILQRSIRQVNERSWPSDRLELVQGLLFEWREWLRLHPLESEQAPEVPGEKAPASLTLAALAVAEAASVAEKEFEETGSANREPLRSLVHSYREARLAAESAPTSREAKPEWSKDELGANSAEALRVFDVVMLLKLVAIRAMQDDNINGLSVTTVFPRLARQVVSSFKISKLKRKKP